MAKNSKRTTRAMEKSETQQQIEEGQLPDEDFFVTSNPIRNIVKINEFKWTENQKAFFKSNTASSILYLALKPKTFLIFSDEI